MSKSDEFLRLEGKVSDVLPNALFRVALTNGHVVIAHLSGKMRKNNIRVLMGDKVDVEVSPYDLTKARVVYRHKV